MVCGSVTFLMVNGTFVWLPQMTTSFLPSGESSTLCGPCSPPPSKRRSVLIESGMPSPSVSVTRYRPLPVPPLQTTYSESKAQSSPWAPVIGAGTFSTIVGPEPSSGAGVIRARPPPP